MIFIILLECIENSLTSFQNIEQQNDRDATYGMTSFVLIVTDEIIYLLDNTCSFSAPKVPDTMVHIAKPIQNGENLRKYTWLGRNIR